MLTKNEVKYLLFVVGILGLICARGAFGQTPAHTATWNVSSTACVTGNTCSAQLFAAVIASGTCPAAGSTAYTLISNLGPATVSATGSNWNFVDSRTTLTTGSVYCGYSTVTFTLGGGPSAAATIFQGTFQAAVITPPSAPTNSITLK